MSTKDIKQLNPVGRPTIKSEELLEAFLNRIMEGHSMRSICEDEAFPCKQTILRWLREDDKFCAQYARAKSIAMEVMAEEIIEISDNDKNDEMAFVGINHIQRDRLKVDSRKWLMSKLNPKKYGDKIQADVSLRVLPPPKWIEENEPL